MTEIDATELVAQVRQIARDFPLPHPRWHRFVPLMHEVVDDLVAALDAIAASPAAQAAFLTRIEAEAVNGVDAPGPALAAAQARLRALPVPDGEHPYLDEIVVALEAAHAALAALASSADGETAFAAARRQIHGHAAQSRLPTDTA